MPDATSPSNPLVKRARGLRLKKNRDRERAFLVEGIQTVTAAVQSDAPVELILYAPELLASEQALDVVEGTREAGVEVASLSKKAFESLSERDNPTGLAAIVQTESRNVDQLVVRGDSLFAVLLDVGNPGNLGAIIRTVDAVGGAGVIVFGESTDLHHPGAVKASMGAIFSVPVCNALDFEQVASWAQQRGVTVVTTSAHAESEHWSTEYLLPAAFVFGSEIRGLPRDILNRGDVAVRIPMAGSSTSLNLAVAAGILLYEARRQVHLSSRST
ncbi:MAG: RNA methyltransferase [Actinomycetota bacterium]|nr:RNA methyltransferase [Actinomycetota bacterium]